MDLIDGLRAFVATAQTGSFTGAAERLGVSNRLTSKYVAELETRLGLRLLQRTTRRVGLTPAGEDLLQRAPSLLEDLDDMLSAVREDSRGLAGTIRVSAPVTFGEVYVAGMLSRFADPHPDLVVDLRLSDGYSDLATDGIDLAFRIGDPAVSSLKARRLGEIRSLVVASPDYLAGAGTPEHPRDLPGHACIGDTNRRDGRRWTFEAADEEISVPVAARFMVNSARAACDLALDGQGIAFCPEFVLGSALQDGRLVRLLADYRTATHPLNAVYLSGNALPRKVRALIDFAVADVKRAGVL